MHAQNRNPQTDLDKILHGGRYPRRSYLHKFWWPSVKGFLGGRGSNFPFSHWLSSSPLQHSRTTVRACDTPGAFRMQENLSATGTPPRTPLGSLQRSPRSSNWLVGWGLAPPPPRTPLPLSGMHYVCINCVNVCALVVTSMQQVLGVRVTLDLPQHNEVNVYLRYVLQWLYLKSCRGVILF